MRRRCRTVFTPDSCPMHLSIAVGTETVALFVKQNFECYGPRQPQGEVVFNPPWNISRPCVANNSKALYSAMCCVLNHVSVSIRISNKGMS